jgi:RNA polymerase sigma-70 factor (ECF subfamily)
MALNSFPLSQSTASAPAPDRANANAALIERICKGDEDAFAEMYRAYAPMVHGILLVRLPREEVQDVVQEVFLAAYRHIHSLRDRNAIGGWLAKIARNHVAEYYRKARPTEELTDIYRSRPSPHAEADEVLSAIRSLPEAYSETLVLRLVEGMTGNEIAEATGLKPESVRVNLHRGMEMLRQKLGIGGAKG